MQSYYEVLGISPDATQGEIRKTFFRVSLEKHPDKAGQSQQTHEYVIIISAYQTLKDATSRAKYDASRICSGTND
jgi:DnaJ-class molecular chaperone